MMRLRCGTRPGACHLSPSGTVSKLQGHEQVVFAWLVAAERAARDEARASVQGLRVGRAGHHGRCDHRCHVASGPGDPRVEYDQSWSRLAVGGQGSVRFGSHSGAVNAVAASARLLIVDDEATILELLSGSLRLVGFEVVTAASGAEAVRARILAQYESHYDGRRPHRSRQLRPPRPDHPVADLSKERIQRRPVLGGLINEYERAA